MEIDGDLYEPIQNTNTMQIRQMIKNKTKPYKVQLNFANCVKLT